MPTLNPFRTRTSHQVVDDDAHRRWEALRGAAADRAEGLRARAADRAEDLLDGAGDTLGHARAAASPHVAQLRTRAADITTPMADRIRQEAAETAARARRELAELAVEVRTASRGEADRIIQVIHEQAEEQRAQERRRRSRAVLGFTVFGMLAGAILWREMEQRGGGHGDDDGDAVAEIPAHAEEAPETPGEAFTRQAEEARRELGGMPTGAA